MILLGISMSMLKIGGGALVTQEQPLSGHFWKNFPPKYSPFEGKNCLKLGCSLVNYELKDMTTSDLFDKQNVTYHKNISANDFGKSMGGF